MCSNKQAHGAEENWCVDETLKEFVKMTDLLSNSGEFIRSVAALNKTDFDLDFL